MIDKDLLEFGQRFHGHKCPAMPMGLRVGAAAMHALGVERAKDGQLMALVELGDNHCATCFADGIQVVTGCTFGKGNIQKQQFGKWGVTLIDKKAGRAVRVTPKAEAMSANKETSFFKDYREQGVPASNVPDEVVEPLIEKGSNAPDAMLLNIGEVFDYQWQEPAHCFATFVCDRCGEMTVEPYSKHINGQHVCLPCSEALQLEMMPTATPMVAQS
jgi:formylmethanofuran dehydrogenase subunit E